MHSVLVVDHDQPLRQHDRLVDRVVRLQGSGSANRRGRPRARWNATPAPSRCATRASPTKAAYGWRGGCANVIRRRRSSWRPRSGTAKPPSRTFATTSSITCSSRSIESGCSRRFRSRATGMPQPPAPRSCTRRCRTAFARRRAVLAAALAEAQTTHSAALDGLITMLQFHERDGRGHSRRVARLTLALADELGVERGGAAEPRTWRPAARHRQARRARGDPHASRRRSTRTNGT